MKTMNPIITRFAAYVGVLISIFACNRNATAPNPIMNEQALQKFPYDTILKYGWYYYANYDTVYTASDTAGSNGKWTPLPYYKKIPVVQTNVCTLATRYYFKPDGSLISIDCNGQQKNVATWNVYQDSTVLDGE